MAAPETARAGALRRYRGQTEKTPTERALQRFAQSRLGAILYTTVFHAIDKRTMPLTRGRLRTTGRFPTLLLYIRGARSGQPRVTPLAYTPRGQELVVVASCGGAKHHPAWYHNLVADPRVEAEIDGMRMPFLAREALGREREKLWRMVNDHYTGFGVYQTRTAGRTIPVIVLEPR
jgi:deazaflavin-dependent oxidoreductase (nitroreductase family)